MKNIFKKIGVSLLGLSLAATSFIGCGASKSADESGKGTESTVYRTVDEIK